MELRKFIATTIREYLNEQQVYSNDLWYHGGKNKINKFIKSPSINRVGNVEGFYFTNNINIAKNYGNEITVVKLNIKKPFILSETPVSDNMAETYSIELHKENPHLPLDGSWIKEKKEYFIKYKKMPFTDMNGLIQQKIFRLDGFDSVIDGHEIVVFDNNDIVIVKNIQLNESEIKLSANNFDINEIKEFIKEFYKKTWNIKKCIKS